MTAAQAPLWAHSDKELRWRHRQTGSRRGVQRGGGGARARSCESGTWRMEWRPLRFKGRHRGLTTRTTQQPYLLRLLCLSCQGSLTQCPLMDTGRRPLAQANCWLCPPWSHTSAPPSAAGASLGQTGAWLWWAMRKVIFFCRRWKRNSQATGEGRWGRERRKTVQLSSTSPEEGSCMPSPTWGPGTWRFSGPRLCPWGPTLWRNWGRNSDGGRCMKSCPSASKEK